MKKWMPLAVVLAVGGIGAGTLQRAAQGFRAVSATSRNECQRTTNALAALDRDAAELRSETSRKQAELSQILQSLNLSPELREWLRGGAKPNAKLDSKLRQQLGIGWNSCPDFILISREKFKDLSFGTLTDGQGASASVVAYFSISPDEQAGIKAALEAARKESFAHVERLEPSGDIVAQYQIQLDANAATVSNQFFLKISGALGAMRAEAFCPGAFREVASALGPCAVGPLTLTVRQMSANGEPDLMWETNQGGRYSQGLVRSGYDPTISKWLLRVFPGGWQPLLEREGITMPKAFNGN
jgi:hypothetical protein